MRLWNMCSEYRVVFLKVNVFLEMIEIKLRILIKGFFIGKRLKF